MFVFFPEQEQAVVGMTHFLHPHSLLTPAAPDVPMKDKCFASHTSSLLPRPITGEVGPTLPLNDLGTRYFLLLRDLRESSPRVLSFS